MIFTPLRIGTRYGDTKIINKFYIRFWMTFEQCFYFINVLKILNGYSGGGAGGMHGIFGQLVKLFNIKKKNYNYN